MSLVKFATILLATATVSQISSEALTRRFVLAQSFGDNSDSFSIPGSLPDGTTLKVDGSTSMRLTNQAIENRFEQQFPNVNVELDASRTDEAFQALIDGDIDILATGRPLTEAEKSQGVIEVSLEQREKLAIILGPDNEFEGDLTFVQFARIFRGEITNWSELGGPDIPIRLVDRPDYSDTRRALSTYGVFEVQPFKAGNTVDPVSDDETDTVIKALGNDGIGYSVASQVAERDDVRIIPMHQTLPDDPRYPYSQYRAFVYKEAAGPAVLAFLGFATTAPGQEVFDGVATASETTASAPASSATDTSEDVLSSADSSADSSTSPAGSPATDATTGPSTSTDTAAPADIQAAPADTSVAAPTAGRGRFPFWLLPLFAIPLLGILLWWLLKADSSSAPGGAAPGGAAPSPRIILTPQDCRNAYAYWEVSQERLTETKRQGGETMMLRLYDVTGRSKNSPLPAPAAEFPCLESSPDLHIPIAMDNRSYCAEIGYIGKDNQWLPIAKSDPVRVPVCQKPASEPVLKTDVRKPIGKGALGGAALAGAAALGATTLAGRKAAKPSAGKGRMVLTPRSSQDMYAYWEIPQEQLADAKLQGGETMVAKLYDVTDRSNDAVLPAPITQIECTEADMDAHFPTTSDRDYMAEVGYQTASGNWLSLVQSSPVLARMGNLSAAADGAADKLPVAAGIGAAVVAAAGVAAINTDNADKPKSATASRIVLTPQNHQKAYAYWEVTETAQSALRAEGGEVYQLRIHDVTGIDFERQAPNSTLTYDLATSDCDRTVPLPNPQSDYVAEVGYQTAAGDWLTLARSTPVNTASPTALENPGLAADTATQKLSTTIPAAAGVGLAAAAALQAQQSDFETDSNPDSLTASDETPSAQTFKVHSRNNAVMFDQGQLHDIEHNVASTYQLDPGTYTLRLQDGVFNYDADDNHPGEPFVLLWIHGGTVINHKTQVAVSSTWTTLNGYDDILTLDVREPAKLCAFFVDTYPDDNSGEVTLTVAKQ